MSDFPILYGLAAWLCVKVICRRLNMWRHSMLQSWSWSWSNLLCCVVPSEGIWYIVAGLTIDLMTSSKDGSTMEKDKSSTPEQTSEKVSEDTVIEGNSSPPETIESNNSQEHEQLRWWRKGGCGRLYEFITWTPKNCRWSKDEPPKFSMGLNLLFGFVSLYFSIVCLC